MLNKSQRPISPQQLFSRLLNTNYKQIQCESSTQKHINQKRILLQLIQQYQISINKQLNKLRQEEQLKCIRLNLISELDRLKRERDIIEEEISLELNRVMIKREEIPDKEKLNIELNEIKSVNVKLRFKLKDLEDYVMKLQAHNLKLEQQRNIVQVNTLNRLRVNQQDWRVKVDNLKRNQESFQNQIKIKMMERETQQIQNIRRQEEEIALRNKQKIQEFQLNRMRNKSINQTKLFNNNKNQYRLRYEPGQRRRYDSFRVI